MISLVNVREDRRCNKNWTIQRNWKDWAYKTKTNKAQTQHNIYWTALYASKHK